MQEFDTGYPGETILRLFGPTNGALPAREHVSAMPAGVLPLSLFGYGHSGPRVPPPFIAERRQLRVRRRLALPSMRELSVSVARRPWMHVQDRLAHERAGRG